MRAARATSAPASASPMAMPRPMPSPAPVTIATRPSTREAVEDHAGPGGELPAGPVQARSGPAGHQRHVEVGEQAGLGRAHVGDGVDAVHGGGDDARVAHEAGLHRLGVQLLEGRQAAGIARDLDLEALPAVPEAPGGVEMLLAHQPVDRGGDHRLAVDHGLPREPLRGHGPRLDRARWASRSARWRPPSRGWCAAGDRCRSPARRPP